MISGVSISFHYVLLLSFYSMLGVYFPSVLDGQMRDSWLHVGSFLEQNREKNTMSKLT